MVTLTIDGQTVEVPEGTTVLNAARKAGIEIPTLCDHPELTPYGGCRLCLVEIEGARTLQTSCTIPAGNNMIVKTHTPKVEAARKFVLTLIFSERNHFCPYCQVSGGDCELQNAAYAQGMTHWPLVPNWTPYPVDASHPYIILEHNRCILCRRCVRACSELVGNHTLGFEERGAKSQLMADLGVPLGESTCVSCGVCLQVCPTGALIDRWSAYRGHDESVQHTETICAGCSVGCTVDVLSRDNQLVRIEGAWNGKQNGGVLCEVGRFQTMDEKRVRLVTPLVRKDGALKAATWDEALNTIAANLRPLSGQNGHGVAALVSTRLPAETIYQFNQLFGRALGSGLVTSTEEASFAKVKEAAELGGGPFETGLDSLHTADFILAAGEDLSKDHQVAGFFVKRKLQSGLKLVALDHQPNGLDPWADESLKVNPGTEPIALLALAAAVVGQTEAVAELAAQTGIEADQFLKIAAMLAGSDQPVFIYGKELIGKDGQGLMALLDLAQIAGARIVGTKGGANSLAAIQYGLVKSFALNGQQAAYLALGDEQPSQRLIQKLEGIPFLAVQASFSSQLTAAADVVLPVETWLEQEGHFVSADGTVQAAQKTLQAPEGVLSNTAVLQAVAQRLGVILDQGWQEALCERPAPVAIGA